MNSIQSDVSALTTISTKALNKLLRVYEWCICEAIKEELIDNKKNSVDIDIGIGILTVKLQEEELRYRFIPSDKLSQMITSTIVDEQSPLKVNLEASVVEKVTNLYKSFF